MVTERKEWTLMNAAAVGEMLCLSKRQVFRLRSYGKLPRPIKIGGSIRWRSSDIELWLDMDCPDQKTFELRKGEQSE